MCLKIILSKKSLTIRRIIKMNTISKILLFTLFIACSISGYGKSLTIESKLQVSDVIQGAMLNVVDPEYNRMNTVTNWEQIFRNDKIITRIILSIDNTDETFQAADYDAEVTIRINREIWNGISFTSTSEDRILRVNFSKTLSYKDKAILQLNGGNVVNIEVLSVTPSAGSVKMNLTLEAQIYIDRFYKLDINESPVIIHDDQYSTSRNELEVSWNNIVGAEEYELEWTYVNNLAINGTYVGPAQVDIDSYIFNNNNTRVSLKDRSEHNGATISYRIPLIYEQGYILYRVRAIGAHEDDFSKIITGAWSSEGISFNNVSEFKVGSKNNFYYNSVGHEKKLNWQSSVTFIEDGKNKIAVSYADGTLRSRQQVSRLNTEDETVIGESIYDHQGRKAIDIIPAPSNKIKIEYTPAFNKNSGGTAYGRVQFDLDTDTLCNIRADSLSDVSGAGNYYSPSNPNQIGRDVYIPDAQGYPFIQTVYTNDNTGRIRAQGGIGVDHQISSGHETKNYYGKPLQVEIDRMFGSEAGFAAHYQKNLVVDPNGQVTVSYLDLQGNVVATSLAGVSPKNLKELESNVESFIASDLLKPQYNKYDELIPTQYLNHGGLSKVFSQELLVSTKGDRNFEYTIEPKTLKLSCSYNDTLDELCFDCVYNLEFLLENKCGEQFLFDDQDNDYSGIEIGDFIIDSIDSGALVSIHDCDRDVVDYGAASSPYLEIGDYTVTKILTVNNKVLNHYTAQFLSLPCHKSLKDFENEKLADVDTLGCGQSCDDCNERLGSFDQYDINVTPDCDPCLTYEVYQTKVEQCNELCDSDPVACDALYEALLMDVTPMGQYGEVYDGQTESVDPSVHKLSLYNMSNILPSNYPNGDPNAHWRNPSHWQKNVADANHYYSIDGSISTVSVKLSCIACDRTDDVFAPEVLPVTPIAVDAEAGVIEVEPQFLSKLEEFIAAWDENWAISLVKYHPEFAAYTYCQEELVSHEFDELINVSTSAANFKTAYNLRFNTTITDDQVYNPAGSNSLLTAPIDPYFINNSDNIHYAVTEHNFVKSRLSDYRDGYSMEKFAHIITNCPQADLNNDKDCGAVSACLLDFVASGGSDDKWNVFKSLYRSTKQRFQEQKRIIYSIQNGYYSGCIGMEQWNAFAGDRFYFHYYSSSNGIWGNYMPSQFFNPKQPCHAFRYMKFKDKRANSVSSLQLMAKADPELAEEECYIPAGTYAEGIIGDGEIVDESCTSRNKTIADRLELVAAKTLIEACGECPVTKGVETLLNAIVQKETDGLLTSNVSLGCYPNGLAEWTGALAEFGGFEKSTTPFEYTVNSSNSSVYQASIDNNSGAPCTVELAFKDVYQFQDYSDGVKKNINNLDWDDIKSLCCMSYTDSYDKLTFDAGYNFTIIANIDVTQADNSIRDEQIILEGKTSCFQLNLCTDTICAVSQISTDIVNLFNSMLYSGEDSSTSIVYPSMFLTSATELSDDENQNRYASFTENLKNEVHGNESEIITKYEWSAVSVSNGTGVNVSLESFKDLNSSSVSAGSVLIQLTTQDGSVVEFSNVKRCISIKPSPIPVTIPGSFGTYTTSSFILEIENLDGTRNILNGSTSGNLILGDCQIFGYDIGAE